MFAVSTLLSFQKSLLPLTEDSQIYASQCNADYICISRCEDHIVKSLNTKFPDNSFILFARVHGEQCVIDIQCIMEYLLLRRPLRHGLSTDAILKMNYCRGSLLKTNTGAAAGSAGDFVSRESLNLRDLLSHGRVETGVRISSLPFSRTNVQS